MQLWMLHRTLTASKCRKLAISFFSLDRLYELYNVWRRAEIWADLKVRLGSHLPCEMFLDPLAAKLEQSTPDCQVFFFTKFCALCSLITCLLMRPKSSILAPSIHRCIRLDVLLMLDAEFCGEDVTSDIHVQSARKLLRGRHGCWLQGQN